MSLLIPKADFLVNLVGTSIMPNLISMVSRLNSKGKVYLIHTKETKKIAENLKEFVNNKNLESNGSLDIKSEAIEIFDYDDPEKVYERVKKTFYSIKKEIDSYNVEEPVIELNYTGATKVISSISYGVFKEIFMEYNINLTYLDGERSEIHIHDKYEKKDNIYKYSSKNSLIPLSVIDVLEVHGKYNDNFNSKKEPVLQSKFSKDIFNYIVSNTDKRNEIISYLKYLYDKLSGKDNFKIFRKNQDSFIDVINDFLRNNTLINEYKTYEDFIRASGVDLKDINILSKKKLEQIINEFTGGWFETVIYKELKLLKDNNIVDDFVMNLTNRNNKVQDYEIDFIAMKDYKMYYFSVSTVDSIEGTEFKLYEIKQRAKILSETESAIATITFAEDKKPIIEGYNSVCNEKTKNLLVVTWYDLPKISKCLRSWIESRETEA